MPLEQLLEMRVIELPCAYSPLLEQLHSRRWQPCRRCSPVLTLPPLFSAAPRCRGGRLGPPLGARGRRPAHCPAAQSSPVLCSGGAAETAAAQGVPHLPGLSIEVHQSGAARHSNVMQAASDRLTTSMHVLVLVAARVPCCCEQLPSPFITIELAFR